MLDAVVAARGASVSEAFRAISAQHRDRCALEADDLRLTYDELDRRSNRVAHALLSEDGDDRPLAMIAPLAPESVVVMLGALKAGRRFAPLDPRDPPDRIRLAVAHLGARLIAGLHELASGRDDDPQVPVSPDHPALVYFTSGSAGRATGLVRNHSYLSYATVGFGFTSSDRAGAILPLAFGGSVSSVFGPLMAGGTACFFDPITRSIGSLAEWIEAAGITFFQTSPSTLQAVAAALAARARTAPAVRLVVIGGEPCEGRQLEVARRVLPRATIANHYGATEASFIAVTRIAPGDPLDPGPMPFRELYPDQTVTIVDETGREVPRGDMGEIRVSSARVALGYCGAPPDNGREFVEEGAGRRSIQLRDRGRLHAGGTLELLGRTDLRVKVHGQAVDLEAVERALAALPGIEGAVVSPVSGPTGQLRLVAHVAGPPARCAPRDLRLGLSKALPPFAIPAVFFWIAEIPRTTRGKIDRTLLGEMAASRARPVSEHVAPRTAREEAIASLVAAALGVTRIGVRDDIFDLGADSLTVVGLLASIGDCVGIAVSLADLLAAPTVEQLAALVGRQAGARHRVVVPVHAGGSGTPLFCVLGAGDGGMLSTRQLGLRLGRPVFSFVSYGFADRALPDRTIPRVAARNVSALREVQPEGPYVIGGLSFGSLVAFEMAKQLTTSGAEVALLVLFDPITSSRWRVANLVRRLGAEQAALGRPGSIVGPFARYLRRYVRDRYRSATAGVVRRPLQQQAGAFLRLHGRMAKRYRLTPYGGSVLLLRTAEWKRFDPRDITRWLTGSPRVRMIPGGHITMLKEPHLTTLAAIVREEIAAATAPLVR